MKRPAYLSIICSLSLLILSACQTSSYIDMPGDPVLDSLYNGNVDSLANLLEEKINPLNLSEEKKADYAFWLAKVHTKQQRSLINDTLIHQSVEFYKRTNSPKLIDAYIMAAKQVNLSGRNVSEQENFLNQALEVAESRKDTNLIQNICLELKDLNKENLNAKKIKRLIDISKKYLRPDKDVIAYATLASLFFHISQPDSAITYIKKGVEITQRNNDSPQSEFELTRSYIGNLNQLGRYNEALQELRELDRKKLTTDNAIKLDYIGTFVGLGELDSAKVYINSFQTLIDKYKDIVPQETFVMDIILKTYQMIIQSKEGKDINAYLYNMRNPINNLIKYGRVSVQVDKERQFLQNKLLKEKFTQDIEREKLKQYLLWVAIVVSFVIGTLIFVYQRKLLQKERFVQKIKEQLHLHTMQLSENESVISKNEELIKMLSSQLEESEDLKQEINHLVEKNDTLKQKNKALQKDIDFYSNSIQQKDEEFVVYEQLTEQKNRLQERERLLTIQLIAQTEVLNNLSKKPRYIEDSQWPEIIYAVNQLFDGFSYRLHADYPSLTDEDIYYCCLFKLRLSSSVVGSLMGISPSSVTKRKQRIKEKMNQQHPTEVQKEQALEIYLWNY